MGFLNRYLENIPEKSRSSKAIAFMASLDAIQEKHPLISKEIIKELADQRSHLKLIASENFSSLEVQLAMGNFFTDKYSEGFVDHRFYAGCDQVDNIERHANNLAKELFGAEHAYVQPHSGADANLVALWSILVQRVQSKELEKLSKKTIDELTVEEHEQVRVALVSQKVMGMSLNSGGHLTHGYRHNITAKMMRSYPYDVDPKTGLIDYNVLQKQVKEVKPLILIAGYSSYPRLIDFSKMREIADSVGAVLLVDMAHFAGLVAGKAIQGNYNPIPFAHIVTSTTHKTLRGPRGGLVLCTNEFKEVVDKGCPLVLGGPMPHVMAAKAVAFEEAKSPEFSLYSHQIIKNSKALAEELTKYGAPLISGGTDNHLIVMDVQKGFNISGRQAELALRDAMLTCNRNSVPCDQNGPWYTSGVRLGTAAVTTLGMKEAQMTEIAKIIVQVLKSTNPLKTKDGKKSKAKFKLDDKILQQSQKQVEEILKGFPLYPELSIFDDEENILKKTETASKL